MRRKRRRKSVRKSSARQPRTGRCWGRSKFQCSCGMVVCRKIDCDVKISTRKSEPASQATCGRQLPSIRMSASKRRRLPMRGVLCKEWGGPEKLAIEEVAAPAMREGAVRISVHAAGINFADLLLISGQYQEKPAFPFTPGMEASGTVAEVGAGVRGLKAGDRVMALTGTGD